MLLFLGIPLIMYMLKMYKKKQYHVGIRQRAIALAGIYKETCTTEPCEFYTEKMDEYFSDSSFDSIENEYASIASLSSPLGEYLEPKKLADN